MTQRQSLYLERQVSDANLSFNADSFVYITIHFTQPDLNFVNFAFLLEHAAMFYFFLIYLYQTAKKLTLLRNLPTLNLFSDFLASNH